MSKEIIDIEGVFQQVKSVEERTTTYEPSFLQVLSFYGGQKRGRMCLISVHQSDGEYAQVEISPEQVKELIEALKYFDS